MKDIFEQNILEKSEQLFLTYGIRSVSMDDVARELGISKKTLYQYFNNKAELVNKTIYHHLDKRKCHFEEILQSNTNAIEQMFNIGEFVIRHLKVLNPSAIYDLKKYYPDSWQLLFDYKKNYIYQMLIENIKKGKEEGLYRSDFNADIIVKLHISRMEAILDPQFFPVNEYNTVEVYTEYLRYHIRGLATEKGLKVLENLNLQVS